MEEKILASLKMKIGSIASDDTTFDNELMEFINDALMVVKQLGAGKEDVKLQIKTGEESWTDLFEDDEILGTIKGLVYLKVKLEFDPPDNSFKVSSFDRKIKEKCWRIRTQIEEGEV